MPKKANTTKKMAATKKNAGSIAAAIAMAMAGGDTPTFGRVDKALGNGMFKITVIKNNKPVEVQGMIRGVLRGGQNSVAFIAADMFVLLSESNTKVHEIAAVINRRSDIKQLKKEGLISKMLTATLEGGEDDLFEDREDEDESDDALGDALGKDSKVRTMKTEGDAEAEVAVDDL